MVERIEFAEAIDEPLLMKGEWDKLSPPQQSALRIFYGLPLDEEGLRHLAMFNEQATYDDLGFLVDVKPAVNYVPTEHEEAWLVFGRRSAKTSKFLAFMLAYEAVLGGHTQYAGKKQKVRSFIVAQTLNVAQSIITDFIEPIISSSKLMEKEIFKLNIDGLALKNGHFIAPAPPSIKAFRSFAIPVVAMDECAFWYKDRESANPDFEVVRAVTPAQGQFPNRKLVGASTMWTKEGIIWEAKNAGSYGSKLKDDDDRKPRYKHALVLTAPTPAMQNPLMLDRKWFEREYKKDPDAYKREILNQAADDISGLFTETILRQALESAPKERDPQPNAGFFYVGTLDPAFRGDSFAFNIGHYDPALGWVQDLIREWKPEGKVKLNPATILDEIKVLLDQYDVGVVYSDQYQLESLQQLAIDRDFAIIGQDFTANSKSKMFGSFQQLMRNGRVKFISNNEQFNQFLWIQKVVGHGGYVRITAPLGKHDDLVTCAVMNCHMSIKFSTSGLAEAKEKSNEQQTPYERAMAGIDARNQNAAKDEGYL